MATVEKQQAGFKFGNSRTEVLKVASQVRYNGRLYKLVRLKIASGEEYYAWRLYNAQGRFIKQFMFEPVLITLMGYFMVHEGIKDLT